MRNVVVIRSSRHCHPVLQSCCAIGAFLSVMISFFIHSGEVIGQRESVALASSQKRERRRPAIPEPSETQHATVNIDQNADEDNLEPSQLALGQRDGEIATKPTYVPDKTLDVAGEVLGVAFSEDDKMLAVLVTDRVSRASIEVWDLAKATRLRTIWLNRDLHDSVPITWFRDKIYVSLSVVEICTVKDNGESLSHIELSGERRVDAVTPCTSNGIVATYGSDETVFIHSLSSGNIISKFVGHAKGVNSAYLANDGSLLASLDEEDTARLWDIASKTLVCTIENPKARDPRDLAVVSKGRLMVLGYDDGECQVFGPSRDGTYGPKASMTIMSSRPLPNKPIPVRTVTVSGNGASLCVSGGIGDANVFTLADASRVASLTAKARRNVLAWSSDAHSCAVAARKGAVDIWTLQKQ